MEPKDPTGNPFAPEYPHLQEWVTEAEARLDELNQEMERTGVAPRLELRPPDPMGATPAAQVRRSRADIQHEKDEKKATVYKRVEKETEKAESQLRKRMQDIAFGRLYSEEIAKLEDANRGLASPATSWSINDVQIKAMAWMKDDRDEQRAKSREKQLHERGVTEPPTPADKALPVPTDAVPTQAAQDAPEPEQAPDLELEP